MARIAGEGRGPGGASGKDHPLRVIRGHLTLGGARADARFEAPRFVVDIPNISTPSNPIERSPHAHGPTMSAGMEMGDPHFLGLGTAEIDGELLAVVAFGGDLRITTAPIASPTTLGPFEVSGPAELSGRLTVYASFADRNAGNAPLADVPLRAVGRAILRGTLTTLGPQVSEVRYVFGTEAVPRGPGANR